MSELAALLKGTSRNLTNANPIDVSIVDGSGNQVTSFGGSGGTASNYSSAFPSAGTAVGFKDQSGNMAPGLLDASGYLEVNVKAGGSSPVQPGTSALTNVSASASSVTLLASNASRLGAVFFNDDTQAPCLIKFGITASATSFTLRLLPGDSYIMAQPVYTGRIDGIWTNSPSGAMRVTELTA